ncbi:MAG TPA: NHL repeat-containing protein [Fimbriimonadaceae bacterium]|nr:NHL repeat-containing protein [Fimbriimonadaceae bacterium]
MRKFFIALTALLAAFVLSSCGGSGSGSSIGHLAGIYFIDGTNNRMIWMSNMTATDSAILDSSVTSVTDVVDGTVDNNGKLYLIDGTNDAIVRFNDVLGSGRASYGSHGNGIGQFLDPVRVAVDHSANVYVVDRGRNALVKFATNGSLWQTLDLSTWFAPGDKPAIVLDAFGHIYLAGAGEIVKLQGFTTSNAVTYGSLGSDVGNFDNPSAIALDDQGKIYVADTGNDRIVRITDITGTGWTTFGTSGSGDNQFSGPTGVSVDHLGSVYIGDSNNHRLVRIDHMTGGNWTEIDHLPSTNFGDPSTVFAHLPNF